MRTIDREAARLADLIIWRLKLARKDWALVTSVLGDKLRLAAWNEATRAMLRDHHYQPPQDRKAIMQDSVQLALDRMGKPIKPGYTIAYPVRQGSKMWLATMRVSQVFSNPPKLVGRNNESRPVEVRKIENVVIVSSA